MFQPLYQLRIEQEIERTTGFKKVELKEVVHSDAVATIEAYMISPAKASPEDVITIRRIIDILSPAHIGRMSLTITPESEGPGDQRQQGVFISLNRERQ